MKSQYLKFHTALKPSNDIPKHRNLPEYFRCYRTTAKVIKAIENPMVSSDQNGKIAENMQEVTKTARKAYFLDIIFKTQSFHE